MNTSAQNGSLRKYGQLIFLVIAFLLLTLTVLGVNYQSTQKLAEYNRALSVSNNQSALIQQLSKNLLDIELYMQVELEKQHNHVTDNPIKTTSSPSANPNQSSITLSQIPQEALYRIQEIASLRNQFDKANEVLLKGGSVQLDGLGTINIQAVSNNPLAKKYLENTSQTWEPYKGLIDSFLTGTKNGDLAAQTSQYLMEYTRLYNRPLQADASKLSALLAEQAQREVAFINQVQLAGIVTALLLFSLIAFGSLRRLTRADRELTIANQELAVANTEMSEIMASVHEGLFLVDRNLQIGSRYSGRLEEIIEQKDLAGKNLLDVIAKFRPSEDLETLQVFIDQLYNEWVVEDLITDLNPLHRINMPTQNGTEKYLDFRFFRVLINEKVERVLVSVLDTTESVKLQQSMDEQNEQESSELEMLNTILNTNPTVFSAFIKDSNRRLQEINQILKSQSHNNQRDLYDKVQLIARLIHSVKGEASSLKLRNIVATCEEFESSLRYMQNNVYLSGQDFLGLIVLLEDLFRMFDVLKSYNARLNHVIGGQHIAPEQTGVAETVNAQQDYLKQFVHDIAERSGKQADLILNGFDKVRLSETQQGQLKDIAIQILRNAVIHGIEKPEIRRQRNKSARGLLRLSLSAHADGTILFEAEDDGNGIDFEAIRKQAVNNGLVPAAEAADLDKRQLLNLMFSSGFSTADESTEDAGKGVGMDIIKTTVQELGGKLNVSTRPESYTRFSFSFPKN